MNKRVHDWFVSYKRLMVVVVVQTMWLAVMMLVIIPWTQR